MSLWAFLGPSLPSVEARRLAPGARLFPPAARGDLFRALRTRRRPRAVAIIDGLFDGHPAIWHREILAALENCVAVFGASSIGALRAAELERFGMTGVGQVYRWVRDGVVLDDAEVALLHAGAEHGYRPLTVPLVNVRMAAALSASANALSHRQAADLLRAAAEIFYQERTWPRIFADLGWSGARRADFEAFLKTRVPDVKADDARACLKAAADFARSGTRLAISVTWPPMSHLVRGRLSALLLPRRDPE